MAKKAMKAMKKGMKVMKSVKSISKGGIADALATATESKKSDMSKILDALAELATSETKKTGKFVIPGVWFSGCVCVLIGGKCYTSSSTTTMMKHFGCWLWFDEDYGLRFGRRTRRRKGR